jgi:hypothetical protein
MDCNHQADSSGRFVVRRLGSGACKSNGRWLHFAWCVGRGRRAAAFGDIPFPVGRWLANRGKSCILGTGHRGEL